MTSFAPTGRSGQHRAREPIAESHREGLREAAEREPQIHRFTNMYTLGFDGWFDLALENSEKEVPFVVRRRRQAGRLVALPEHRAVPPPSRDRLDVARARPVGDGRERRDEVPAARSTRSTRWGAMRVEFKTDARNLRVRGALLGVGGRSRGSSAST